MADYNDEVEAFTSVHNERIKASAPSVTPPSKELKQLILQQPVTTISKETAKAKSSYGILGQAIKE